MYSATWIDGYGAYDNILHIRYRKQNDGSWEREYKSIKVALKRLNGSQNMSDKYLNEVCFHYF